PPPHLPSFPTRRSSDLPFVRKTLVETLFAHHTAAVVPLIEVRAEVPADIQAVVLRCLAKDPADRFPDAHALDKALAGCSAAADWDDDKANAWWTALGDRTVLVEPPPSMPTATFLPTHSFNFDNRLAR